MSEKQRMLQGESYDPLDRELVLARRRARDLTEAFRLAESGKERNRLLKQLLGPPLERVWIEPPFQCDYGTQIHVGRNVFINFNCVILDSAAVTLGDNVFIGPGVHIYTAVHPLAAVERRSGQESAKPVSVGNDVWIGGGAIILPGVSIGTGSVIGAGSVVTRAVPANVVAAGNPCKVIRTLDAGSDSV
ncbi:MAG: maltose acetyltransferase [Alteromonadaceae bacterium]|nr:maltose acetyltransferase [Alteromonadaceae bacterium]|tara:strand:- start:2840 stop:3406 length:567 start_codon:yes stop_codon:yes gene_type:complete